ncbi:MAG: TonB-dependent receptor domain-containing protein, partial [Bacteroidota bacterium]
IRDRFSRYTGLMVLGCIIMAAAACGARGERARLLRLDGLVKIRSGNQGWMKAVLPQHQSLAVHDEVQTCQRATATVSLDGARLDRAPLTHLIIPAEPPVRPGRARSRINLLTGKILIWIVGSRPIEIGTAGAIAAAKSTQFIVSADEAGRTVLTVVEGAVEFYNDLGSVTVAANQQSEAAPGRAPTRPARVDPSSYIEWEASLESLWLGFERMNDPGQTRESLSSRTREALQKAEAAPADPAAQEQAGDLLHDSGDFSGAAQHYDRVTSPSLNLSLKQAYNLLQQGRSAEAERAFATLAEANPTAAAPLLGQATALAAQYDQAKLAQAQEALERACKLDPAGSEVPLVEGLIAIRKGQCEAALKALSAAAAAPNPDYRALAYLSGVQLAAQRPQEALASARKAVLLAPASALAHQSLGTAAFFCGSLTEAAAEANLALCLNPQSASAQLLRSDVAVAQGDLDAGLQAAEAAVELDPRLAPAHHAIGMISLAQNDLKRAEKSFTKALQLSPTLVSAQTGMGMTYARQGRLAQALEMQEGAAALDGSQAAVQNNIGLTYLQTGRLDQAIETFKQALRLQPEWAIVHGNLALAYLESNEYALAREEAETAVRLGGDSARVRTTLARVYLRQNRVNAAWAQLRRALDIDDNYALAHMHLAEVYTRLARPEDAIRERFRGLTLQPSVMVDNRDYARTEVEAAVGDPGSVTAHTMGRGDDGQNSYYIAAEHVDTDLDRPRTDDSHTVAVAIAGRQTSPDNTAVIYASGVDQDQDRPGPALAGGLPSDLDWTSSFRGAELQVLTRRAAGENGDLTWRFGYTRLRHTDQNPDLVDPAPRLLRTLQNTVSGPSVEFRLDNPLGRRDLLTLGAAYLEGKQELSGLLADPGQPGVLTAFANEDTRNIGTGYAEFQRLLDSRTSLLVGARMVAADETEPVIRAKASLRRQVSQYGSLVLLTRPALADDVTSLSPVDRYSLRASVSNLDLAPGGYAQSYELQYELVPPAGLLRVSLFQRDLRNLLIDLEDPRWSTGVAREVIGAATLRGAEVEFERELGDNLTVGAWARYTDSDADDLGGAEVPYQPRLQGQVRLDYLDAAGWQVGAALTHVGERYAHLGNSVELGSYSLLSMAIARQLDLHTFVFLNVQNALDRDYQFFRNYPGAGAEVSGGVRYRF